MKTDEKTTLGFIFMIYLAESYGLGYVKINEILKKQKVSVKYLESVVAKVRAAGLVDARKGSAGGYILSKPPEKISLLDIYECLNGPVADNQNYNDDNAYRKTVSNLWSVINSRLNDYLASRSLEDLFQDWKKNQTAMPQQSGGGFYF